MTDAAQNDIEARKLELEREKAASDDRWRKRTLWFSIGSAVLSAIIALSVAFIAKPSPFKPNIDVARVQDCRNSVKRLVDFTKRIDANKTTLSQAIEQHANTCEQVLDDVIGSIATGKST
jgi:hypothetical protein